MASLMVKPACPCAIFKKTPAIGNVELSSTYHRSAPNVEISISIIYRLDGINTELRSLKLLLEYVLVARGFHGPFIVFMLTVLEKYFGRLRHSFEPARDK